MICDFYSETTQYQENLLAKYYTKSGHEVTIIASTFDSAFDYINEKYDSKIPAKIYNNNGIKIFKLPYSLNILNKLRKFSGILNILKEAKPNLIFVHDIHLNISDAVCYKRLNDRSCRIIMDYHGDYSNSAKNWISLIILHKIIRKTLLYRYLNQIDRIYYVVPSSAKFLHEVYGLSYERMQLLILGADTDLVNEIRESDFRKVIRSKFSINDNCVTFFTGGKITRLKRTELLIRAVAELANVNLCLFIVGDCSEDEIDYKQQLVKLAEGNKNIHFIGWLTSEEVYQYLAASDVAIFPASQSILWQQALGMGLPIVVGQVADQNISYLNNYKAIVTIPEAEIGVESIKGKLLEFVKNENYLKQTQLAAQITADELLNYYTIIKKTLE